MTNRFTLQYSSNGIPKIRDEKENIEYCNLDTKIYVILQVLNELDNEKQLLENKCEILKTKCELLSAILDEHGIEYGEEEEEEI